MPTGSAEQGSQAVDNHLLQRGVKGSNPLGTALFVGLRSADPVFQYQILRHDWGERIINALGSSTLPHGPTGITNTVLDQLGLSPYRLILLAMAAGSAIKQNYWLLAIAYEKMPPSASIIVSALNTANNSINSLMFICAATSASVNGEHFPQTPLVIGSLLYALGIVLETGSEIQRYHFKRNARNKGKAFTGGLFGVARHINYTGYLLWRVGYAMAAGGYIYSAAVGAFFFYNFTNSIPPLDKYCTEHYGEQWTTYKEKTPWKMIPYVY